MGQKGHFTYLLINSQASFLEKYPSWDIMTGFSEPRHEKRANLFRLAKNLDRKYTSLTVLY